MIICFEYLVLSVTVLPPIFSGTRSLFNMNGYDSFAPTNGNHGNGTSKQKPKQQSRTSSRGKGKATTENTEVDETATTTTICQCPECKNEVLDSHNAVECDGCKFWIHCICGGVSKPLYDILNQEDGQGQLSWYCPRCAVSIKTTNERLKTLTVAHDKLYSEVASVKTRLQTAESEITEIHQSSAELKDEQSHLKNAISDLNKEQKQCITDKELNDRLARLNNVIVHGVPESKEEEPDKRMVCDRRRMELMCTQVLNIPRPEIESVRRLGLSNNAGNGKPRPLQMSFKAQPAKMKVLRSSGALKSCTTGDFKEAQVREDRTPFQREQMRYLVKLLKTKQEESDAKGEDRVWKIRGYEVVEMKQRGEER